MEKYRCKICSKSFMNGKALGGHMSRSHFTKLPLPPKTPTKKLQRFTESTPSEFSSKGKETEQIGVVYELNKDSKKRFKVMDDGYLDSCSVMQDIESETESTLKPTRRRSKRVKRNKKTSESVNELEIVDEDVALWLLMLSRDFWRSDDSVELTQLSKTRVKHHLCDTCNKEFKSSQALGSHRIIHGKVLKKNCFAKGGLKYEKLHECPFCGKVFNSGQALGGHKRSHFLGTSTISTASCSSSRNGDNLMDSNSAKLYQHGPIDLNFPAPTDDDNDDEEDFSQQEVSAVSNFKFVANHVPTI